MHPYRCPKIFLQHLQMILLPEPLLASFYSQSTITIKFLICGRMKMNFSDLYHTTWLCIFSSTTEQLSTFGRSRLRFTSFWRNFHFLCQLSTQGPKTKKKITFRNFYEISVSSGNVTGFH